MRVEVQRIAELLPRANARVHPMAKTAKTLTWNGQGEILPTQAPQLSMPRLEPVKRLMLAVLGRAVNDFHTYASVPTARGRRLFTEADAWFRSSTGGPFDFESICHATELDPDFIRNGLRSSYGPGRQPSINGHHGVPVSKLTPRLR